MTQEEIWEEHIKNTTVNDVMKEYPNPAVLQTELANLINHDFYKKNNNIIEVVCELGVTSMLLNDNFQKTLLDLNPLAIELTKKVHKQFNIVFNVGVIEHFNKYEGTNALREYSRILKDDGVIYIAFPNHYSVPYRLAYKIRKLLNKWPYPDEYKIYDLKYEIENSNLYLEDRIILSKKSVMNWLNFIPLLKKNFEFLDIFYKFEGYLSVLKIRKKV